MTATRITDPVHTWCQFTCHAILTVVVLGIAAGQCHGDEVRADDAKTVDRLIANLQSSDVTTRVNSASALGGFPRELRRVHRALVPALRDKHVMVRMCAVHSLGRLALGYKNSNGRLERYVTRRIRADIARLLRSETDDLVRYQASIVFDAVPLKMNSPCHRVLAERPKPKSIDRWLDRLRRADVRKRWLAADALGEFPQAADVVSKALEDALNDPKPSVRFRAARSLGSLLQAIRVADPEDKRGIQLRIQTRLLSLRLTETWREVAVEAWKAYPLGEFTWYGGGRPQQIVVQGWWPLPEIPPALGSRKPSGKNVRHARPTAPPPALPEPPAILLGKSNAQVARFLKVGDAELRLAAYRELTRRLARVIPGRFTLQLAFDRDPFVRHFAMTRLWNGNADQQLAGSIAYALQHNFNAVHLIELAKRIRPTDSTSPLLLPRLVKNRDVRLQLELLKLVQRLPPKFAIPLGPIVDVIVDPESTRRINRRIPLDEDPRKRLNYSQFVVDAVRSSKQPELVETIIDALLRKQWNDADQMQSVPLIAGVGPAMHAARPPSARLAGLLLKEQNHQDISLILTLISVYEEQVKPTIPALMLALTERIEDSTRRRIIDSLTGLLAADNPTPERLRRIRFELRREITRALMQALDQPDKYAARLRIVHSLSQLLAGNRPAQERLGKIRSELLFGKTLARLRDLIEAQKKLAKATRKADEKRQSELLKSLVSEKNDSRGP